MPSTLLTALIGVALAAVGIPSWAALLSGMAVALITRAPPNPALKVWTARVLQWGVVALGAGMNLAVVLRTGRDGALLTLVSLVLALAASAALGRLLKVDADTTLLIGVGTAICGGSAIAAVASVIRPKSHEASISLGVVFLLNAVGLMIFPPIGHALGLSEPSFGRWAALAIHDTSSVVGAAMSFGPEALEIATATKLARALWIVPLTIGIALWRQRGQGGELKKVKWPVFIGVFLAVAALFTWVPALAPLGAPIVLIGRRLLVLALYLVGLGLSWDALRGVGRRALALGVLLWLIVGSASLPLAKFSDPGPASIAASVAPRR